MYTLVLRTTSRMFIAALTHHLYPRVTRHYPYPPLTRSAVRGYGTRTGTGTGGLQSTRTRPVLCPIQNHAKEATSSPDSSQRHRKHLGAVTLSRISKMTSRITGYRLFAVLAVPPKLERKIRSTVRTHTQSKR